MGEFRGLLGLLVLVVIAVVVSRNRLGIRWRTVVAALALQFAFAALVLRWEPGRSALDWLSGRVETLIGYARDGN